MAADNFFAFLFPKQLLQGSSSAQIRSKEAAQKETKPFSKESNLKKRKFFWPLFTRSQAFTRPCHPLIPPRFGSGVFFFFFQLTNVNKCAKRVTLREGSAWALRPPFVRKYKTALCDEAAQRTHLECTTWNHR